MDVAMQRHRRAARTIEACSRPPMEAAMNDEVLNMSIRKFLKMVGVNSQRDIERAVAEASAAGTLPGPTSMPASMTLEVPALKLSVRFDGTIDLE
jgi:uncharacterized protein DUF6494